MKLENKNIILTGCASGIGLELLKLLLKTNCRIIACDLNIERLDISKTNTNQPDSVPQKNNAVLFKYKCDVSSKTQLDSLFNFAKEKLGDIDIFIANAGFAYYEKIEGADWNHISKIFETNVMSFIYCAEKMKVLHGEKPYNFVVTGSSMGLLSMPGYSLYSATKAAVRGFADSYRLELSKGQHLQVVYPIATKTKFFSTAANNTPVPFPTQTPEAVAKKIVHGIKKNKNHIFSSTVFSIMNFLNRFLPFIFKIYVAVNNCKFKNWSEKNNKGNS